MCKLLLTNIAGHHKVCMVIYGSVPKWLYHGLMGDGKIGCLFCVRGFTQTGGDRWSWDELQKILKMRSSSSYLISGEKCKERAGNTKRVSFTEV